MLPKIAKTLAKSLIGAFPVALGLIISGEDVWRLFNEINQTIFLIITSFILLILAIYSSRYTFYSTGAKIWGTIFWFILFLIVGVSISFILGIAFSQVNFESLSILSMNLIYEDDKIGTLLAFGVVSAVAAGVAADALNNERVGTVLKISRHKTG